VEGDNRKRIHAKFYAEPGSRPPSEPVREWLRSLTKEEMREIGRDIRVVEMSWPRVQEVKPRLVDYPGNDIWEVRVGLRNRIARVLFSVEAGGVMLLLDGFIKKTRKTPRHELDLALARLKKARMGR
jgi:phage-related protein